MAIFRDYEVSVWTLQDEFLTVLKPRQADTRKFLDEPQIKLNVDGTEEFTFSVPMYIYEGTERIENPIWYNTHNGILLASLRKIKVIFNPQDDNKRKIFEFLITKIEERHSNDTLYCDVTCEGLAFHELGKIGYKISFSADVFYDEDYNKFKESNNELHATIDYWLKKFLTPYDTNEIHHISQWYYIIDMDWSAFSKIGNFARASNKIYEDPYISSWNINNAGKIIPRGMEQGKEKERIVEAEESNFYNLTQTIAETFGVFCRYEHEHDTSYHIVRLYFIIILCANKMAILILIILMKLQKSHAKWIAQI